MTLTILGSNSDGNAYLLHTSKEALMLEAGVQFKKVQREIDYNTGLIKGCIITHEHGDHAAFAGSVQAHGIRVMASAGTISAINSKEKTTNAFILEAEKTYKIGGFRVMPFNVNHDAAEPFGYLIQHPEMGVALFATDTASIEQDFEGLNKIIIEANFSEDIVDRRIMNGHLSATQASRTRASHMSIEKTKRFLETTDLTAVTDIVLIHLSDGNSNAEDFKKTITAASGKKVWVADKEMSISFMVEPF